MMLTAARNKQNEQLDLRTAAVWAAVMWVAPLRTEEVVHKPSFQAHVYNDDIMHYVS